MRAVLIVILVVIAMVLVGWLTFTFTNHSATISVDPDKVQHDTSEAVEEAKDLLNDAGKSIDRAVDGSADRDDR